MLDSQGIQARQTNSLEGQGDVTSRLIMGISKVIIWVIGAINLLTKFSPDPSSIIAARKRPEVRLQHETCTNLRAI